MKVSKRSSTALSKFSATSLGLCIMYLKAVLGGCGRNFPDAESIMPTSGGRPEEEEEEKEKEESQLKCSKTLNRIKGDIRGGGRPKEEEEEENEESELKCSKNRVKEDWRNYRDSRAGRTGSVRERKG